MAYLIAGHRSGAHQAAREHRELGGAPHGAARLGRAALDAARSLAPDRRARHVLGHLPAHRQRPRRRSARQPGSLPDPRRPLRRARGRRHVDCAVRHRAPREDRRPPRRRLVGAGRRPDDGRLRCLRAHGLPARRHVAPAVRPGRDALGPDSPDADRRRVARDARRHGADGRGDHGRRPRSRARGNTLGLPPAPRPPGGRLPRRALHLPGRVRLRRSPVPRGLPADPDDAGGRHRPRGHAAIPRTRRRAARGRGLRADSRLPGDHGRRRLGPDDAPLPALHRRGPARGGGLPPRGRSQPGGERRHRRRADRHGRPRGRVGLVSHLDADPLERLAPARGRDRRPHHRRCGRRRGRIRGRRAHRPQRRADQPRGRAPARVGGSPRGAGLRPRADGRDRLGAAHVRQPARSAHRSRCRTSTAAGSARWRPRSGSIRATRWAIPSS